MIERTYILREHVLYITGVDNEHIQSTVRPSININWSRNYSFQKIGIDDPELVLEN